MALLNYGLKDSEWLDYVKGTTTDPDKYLKLVFTEDGHIITHGTDYLPTFDISTISTIGTEQYRSHRGLLDTSIITNKLDSSNKLVSSAAVLTYLNTTYADAIKAKDFLQFKGVLSSADDLPRNGFKQGDTYRVNSGNGFTINLGGDAQTRVTTGDIVICIKDYAEGDTGQCWSVIEANIDGTSTLKFLGNNTVLQVASQNVGAEIINIVTSKNSPQANYILQADANKTPSWVNPMDGTFKVSWASNAETAAKVANALSFGDTLSTSDGVTEYDGSSPITLNVKVATPGNLGILTINTNDKYFTIENGYLGFSEDVFKDTIGNLDAIKYSLTTTTLNGTVSLGLESDINKSYIQIVPGNNISLSSQVDQTTNSSSIVIAAQHRDISINGESIGNKSLNFIAQPQGSIGIVTNMEDLNSSNGEIFDIGFDLYWFNLSTNKYEI